MSQDGLKQVWNSIQPISVKSERAWNEIEAAYGQPNRSYHTLKHVAAITSDLRELFRVNYSPLYFAAFYHDYCYSTKYPGNEELSAEIAYWQLIMLGFDGDFARLVHRIIVATKHHSKDIVPKDEQSTVGTFMDADLAIIGSDPLTYEVYRNQIRCEYSHVPEVEFNEGRSSFLKKLLERKTLFYTQPFKDKYYDQATINIKQELELLNGCINGKT